MPVETLHSPLRQPARAAITPPRLRPKAPVGMDFVRQSPLAASRPKQSAVERLEADKAKYVKSQVALSKQQPVRPPELRKPLIMPTAALQPTRKTPSNSNTQQGLIPFNLEHLSNLISGVNDGPFSAATHSEDCQPHNGISHKSISTRPAATRVEQKEDRQCPLPCPDWTSPAKVRLKACGPVKAESPGSVGSPTAVTIRRVDVMPQVTPSRTPCRPQLYMRQPLYPMPLHSQFPLRPATSHPRLFSQKVTPGPSPVKPVRPPPQPNHTPTTPVEPPAPPRPALPSPNLLLLPPASPAITHLSSSSSRKRPSLTRSKSDMSDRYSRAGTELERFFNLCGVDPPELQDLTGSPGSDIVSMTRFRSASAPGSECAGSDREDDEEEEEDDDGDAANRVPYGVSVIERNARVIKWLYGLRHAKGNAKSTDM